MKRPQVVYCDTNILIAWLTDEKRADPTEMDAVYECMREVDRGRIILCISDYLCNAEILAPSTGRVGMDRLNVLFRSRKLQGLDTDSRAQSLAGEIREYYAARKLVDGLSTLSLPDATHLATAIRWRVPIFYTFDDGKRKARDRSLLSLSGSVAGHPLLVSRPPLQQPYLLRPS
jgi:predicted nucleic acid-binding protein